MLYDNGIKVVKKGNTIIAQNGSSVYELTVSVTEDEALNQICYHGEANVKIHGESEKEANLAIYAFGPSVGEYDLDDIVYKVMQTVDGVGVLYAIDEDSNLGKRCTIRMHDEDAMTTVVFSKKGVI